MEVEPCKIVFFVKNTIHPKEDTFSLSCGHHSIHE